MDVEALHCEAKDRYWKDKDLAGSRRFLAEGIAAARVQGNRDFEKPLQYDLAAFCWPGWDEPGISISEEDLAAGEHAASENLRLAKELNRPGAAMANAQFMVGGYHLARRRHADAADSFARQREWAEMANDLAGQALASGYVALANHLAGESDSVEPSVEMLRTSGWEHGEFFACQLETAARVFGP